MTDAKQANTKPATWRAWLPVRRWREPPPVVAVLPMSGAIGRMGALRDGLTLAGLADSIERAFRLRHLAAVALVVNSPGGAPVQAALIAKRIRALADEKDLPVVAFAEDVAASGGYWLACAADEIFADENSIIGSIGVVSGGFGLQGLIHRLGIERRLHTAGDHKAMLDPFQREKPEDVERLKALQGDIHESFKNMVRNRRGDRLKADEEVLFSGEFWTGARAEQLGLIDGIGDLRSVMRDRYGDHVRLRVVGRRTAWWRRLGFFKARAGAPAETWAAAAIGAVEERMMWNRFGL